jgi:hypothetical protein
MEGMRVGEEEILGLLGLLLEMQSGSLEPDAAVFLRN